MPFSPALTKALQTGDISIVASLITEEKAWDEPNQEGLKPIHIAMYYGHFDLVKWLLKNGVSPECATVPKGSTPLHEAACYGQIENIEFLLKVYQDNPNKRMADGNTPLSLAVKGGRMEAVALLLKNGADTRIADNDGLSPLHFAVINNIEAVSLLLEHGADIHQASTGGVTPLNFAAVHGNKEIVALLLARGANVHQAANNGQSPLYFSAYIGYEEVAELLLERGANINQVDNNGTSPLHIAACNGKRRFVAFLLEHGADIHQVDNNGASPLCIAASNGHDHIVALLLEHGADIHQVDYNGASPLHVAAQKGQTKTVALLLKQGADIHQTINDGASPLYLAAWNGHTKTVALLLEHGADIRQANNKGESSLYAAAQQGHTITVALLLEHAADIHQVDHNGASPLYIAACNNHTEIVALLLKSGANIHQANSDGSNSLYISAYNGHKEIVSLLLACGADIHQANNKGLSPLYTAAQEGHLGIVHLLLSHGANTEQASKDTQSTPLWIAAHEGHREVVLQLLEAHALMTADYRGDTPLHIAVKEGHSAIVKLLLEHHAAVSAVNILEQTPLLLAAASQDAIIFGLLLAAWFDQQKAPLSRLTTREAKGPLKVEIKEESIINQTYKPYGVYEKVRGVFAEGLLTQSIQTWPTLPATVLARAKATRKHLAFEISEKDVQAAKYLGRGAFGEVFRFALPNHSVALKRIRLEKIAAWFKVSTEDAQNILQWEISQLEKVQHPHVVELLGISSNETPFIAMELCDTTLDKAIPEHNYLQWQVAWEVACGLVYLHHLSLVHRDLKPENILLKDGIAKIADMGLAQIDPLLLDRREPAELQGLIGDLRFASPEEQAAFKAFKAGTGSLADIKAVSNETTDIYRYGLVLKTFNNTSWQALSNACLQNDPQARPSALQIIAALEQLIPHTHPALAKVCQRLGIFAHYHEHELSQFLVPWVNEQAEVDWLSYQEGIEVTGADAPKSFSTLWQDFLQSPSKSLEIRGAGGLGKTLLGYYYLKQQWQALRQWLAHPQGEPPTVVLLLTPDYLPTTAFSLEERLQELYHLTTEELASLRQYPLVFLLDGEDEWQAKPNIDLSQWPHSKCWTLGRPSKAEEAKETKTTPKAYLLPFNQLQMVAYLSNSLNWDQATAQDFISQLPFSASKEVLRNPFVLAMFSRLWPLPNWQHLTQEKIYHTYFTHYIERQAKHWLSGSYQKMYAHVLNTVQQEHKTLGESYLHYAGEVSLHLFEERRLEGRIHIISPWTTIQQQIATLAEKEYQEKQQLLAASGEKTHLSLAQYQTFAIAHGQRLVLPPPLQEGYYRFMHKSLFEYAWSYTAPLPNRPLEEDESLLITYGRQHQNEKPDLSLISATKKNPTLAAKAGNLLTLYNWARLPLAYDYRGAHIENANLAYANLIGADLRESTWRNCYFANACLVNAQLDGPLETKIALRPHPSLLGHDKTILLTAISPDGKYLATLDKEKVLIWNNQQRIRAVAIKIPRPTALALNSEGAFLIGDKEGMIHFFSAENSLGKKFRACYNEPVLNVVFIKNLRCWVGSQHYNIIYDCKTFAREQQWQNDKDATCTTYHPELFQQVIGTKNGEIKLVNVKEIPVKKVFSDNFHQGANTALSFSLTDKMAMGGEDGLIFILVNNSHSKTFYFNQPILSLHWSQDSQSLVAISSQGFKVWDVFGMELGNFKTLHAIQAIYLKNSHEGILIEKSGNLYGITLNNGQLDFTWVVAGGNFQGGIAIQPINQVYIKEKSEAVEQKELNSQNTDELPLLVKEIVKETEQVMTEKAQEEKIQQPALEENGKFLLSPALQQQGLFADRNQSAQQQTARTIQESSQKPSLSLQNKTCCTLL